MLQLSHLKQIVAFFVFIKSTKPNLHYPVCSGCLLHVGLPCIFPWCWFVCGTNQDKRTQHFKYG